jgi:hypothetical protein
MKLKHMIALICGQVAVMSVLIGCVTLQQVKDAIPQKPVGTPPTTTTTTIPLVVAPAVNYTKDFDMADAEKDNSTYCGGVEIRCLVNDNMMSKDVWITQLSRREGGMTLVANADGSVTCTGKDFVTKNNKYRFEGWKIRTDQSKLVTDAVITLKGGDKGGTTRGYWRTIK